MRTVNRFAAAIVLAAATLFAASPPAHAANLLGNPGFETGTLSPWSCTGGTGSVVSMPVHSGTRARAGAASASDNARCSQTVAVQANTAYALSAWVRGNYVYLGIAGGASTWTPSAAGYPQLTVNLTTGAGQTSVEVFVHGWYGQGTYYADDVSLDGPGGSAPPGVPGGLRVTGTTNGSISLAWTASAGATGYRVYEGGTQVASGSATSAIISGLPACSTHAFTVTAFNANGESARSGCYPPRSWPNSWASTSASPSPGNAPAPETGCATPPNTAAAVPIKPTRPAANGPHIRSAPAAPLCTPIPSRSTEKVAPRRTSHLQRCPAASLRNLARKHQPASIHPRT